MLFNSIRGFPASQFQELLAAMNQQGSAAASMPILARAEGIGHASPMGLLLPPHWLFAKKPLT